MDIDFSIIKQAGITQMEFSGLAGVSRTTANMWVSGGQPHRFLRPKVAAVVTALTLAVKNELLPLPKDDVERLTRIRHALREAAKKPQTAEV